MNDSPRHVLGVDIGGTKVSLGVVDAQGNVLYETRFPTPAGTGEVALKSLISSLGEALKEWDIASVGVGVAGQVSFEGEVLCAPNLGWENIPFKKVLEQALGLPVSVLNDVRAATLGEWRCGAGRGYEDLLCLFVGTGLGGGVVSAGKLMMGATNAIGEVGHTPLVWNGRLCGCGARGCLEAYASGSGLCKSVQEAALADRTRARRLLDMVQGKVEALHASHLLSALEQKDPLALELFDHFCGALITGVAGLVNAFNPAGLVLGGGMFKYFPTLFERVQEEVPKKALKAAVSGLSIHKAQLGDGAPVVGAALYTHNY